jgi:hypothetical protein
MKYPIISHFEDLQVQIKLFLCYLIMYDLQLSRRHCIIKSSQATSRVRWLREEKAKVSRTISVLVFRSLMWLEKQSVPGIGLPEFHAQVGVLPNGSCRIG